MYELGKVLSDLVIKSFGDLIFFLVGISFCGFLIFMIGWAFWSSPIITGVDEF